MADWWDSAAVEARAKKVALDAIEEYAQGVLNASKELVPLNKDPNMAWHRGTLQRTGAVLRDDDGVTIRYSVDDERYNYALIQHETTTFKHETGTHHYLSVPFQRMAQSQRFFRFVEQRLRQNMR
jgi:hypothetical protein